MTRPPVLRTALLLLMLVLAAPSPAAAQPASPGGYVRVDTWQETATSFPPSLWSEPSGLDIGASGLVATADARLRRLELLDASGSPIAQFGRGGGALDLDTPGALALDEAGGRLYSADPGAGRIAVYRLDGTLEAHWTGMDPAGLALLPDGRLAVADAATERVRVLRPDGSEDASWGAASAGSTPWARVGALALDEAGLLHVLDRGNERIVMTDLDGAPRGSLRVDAPELAGAELHDLAVDGEEIWLASSAGIARIAREGGRLRGFFPDAPSRALALRPSLGLLAAVEPAEGPAGIWRYRYGQASGEPQERWGGPIRVPGFFDGLEVLSFGADGKAYLLDVPPRIQRLDARGQAEAQIDAPDPVEVTADAAGTVYAAAGREILAYDPGGALRWSVSLSGSFPPGREAEVVGLGWDPLRDEVLALEATGARLHAYSSTGEERASWPLRPADANRAGWTDLAVAPDGLRYALDRGGQQVRAWDAAGVLQHEIDLPAPARRFDLAPDGSLLLLSADGWARRILPDGQLAATWDATRLDLGRRSRAVDIALDGAGRPHVLDAAARVISVYDWDPDRPPVEPPVPAEGCEGHADKQALPASIELGETVAVQLTVRGGCAAAEGAADIALLLDTSLDRTDFRSVRRAAEDMVALVDPTRDRLSVQPGQGASGRLTNDAQFLRRALRRLDQEERFGLRGEIEAAEAELFGRRARPDARKVMVIVFGSGRDDETSPWEWQRAVQAAVKARRRGAEIYTIAVGRKADTGLLVDIASSRDQAYEARILSRIDQIYAEIVGRIRRGALWRSLVVRDRIPENMAYVPGSAQPPAVLTEDRSLVWTFAEVPLQGLGMRYDLRPREPGTWPTNVEATGDYVGPEGETGRIVFPVPVVEVRPPPASATPEPSPTTEPTPAPSREPTPTAVATATPAEAPARRVYLPALMREDAGGPSLRNRATPLPVLPGSAP